MSKALNGVQVSFTHNENVMDGIAFRVGGREEDTLSFVNSGNSIVSVKGVKEDNMARSFSAIEMFEVLRQFFIQQATKEAK